MSKPKTKSTKKTCTGCGKSGHNIRTCPGPAKNKAK